MTIWHWLVASAAVVLCTVSAHAAPPDPAAVEKALWDAATWQMAHREKFKPVEWEIAPLYDGLLAAGTATGKAAYVGEVVIVGRQTGHALGKRLYHADDHAVGHAWLDLYLADPTSAERLAPTRAQLDRVIAEPELRPLEIGKPGPDGNRWTWCDALYMGPPTFARLYAATGDRKYLDFLDREWRYTYDLLWDADAKLFYRDSRFKVQKSANGKKVFWSRGNGWVVGGLALMLPLIPEDHPTRPLYVETFKQMAAALVPLQREDGLWSPSLLDDKDPDLGETSGSAFFVYGLAWGVNNGLLDRATYAPVIERGWAALLTRQLPSGQIGYVQQVGDRPGNVKPEDHHTYGTGAFLLAGSEILRGLRPEAARTLKQLLPDAESYADAALGVGPATRPATNPADSLRPVGRAEPRVIERNAGWCWFQDERAIVVGDQVVFGSVAGNDSHGSAGGDVKVTSLNLTTGAAQRFVLHEKLNRDDHAAPALLHLVDGRLLAVYSGHSTDKSTRSRVTTRPGDITAWEDERTFDHAEPVCYSNLFYVRELGRPFAWTIWNFVRADGYNPNVMRSEDGRHWQSRGKLLAWPDRPYLKYASDGSVVHFIATDGHPRVFDNSLYYGAILSNGMICNAAGDPIGQLGGGGVASKAKFTKIFQGDPQNVAWPVDFGLTKDRRPVLIFSVQKDGAAIKNEPAGGRCWDHRFMYARLNDDGKWTVTPLAYAGSSLYAAEPDYTGLAALDPNDDTTVVISADVHPVTGLPNVSTADNKRHYELFRGTTADDGRTWAWAPLTENSTVDNLRPVIPADAQRRVILWTRGTLRTYTDYDLDVVGLIEPRS